MFESSKVEKLNFTNLTVKDLLSNLEKLGRLKDDSYKPDLLNLLFHENDKIKIAAIKNLAKFADLKMLDTFVDLASNSKNSEIRREASSAIGRLRSKEAIPALEELLIDEDPKVVMQAIRGLLVFKKDPDVLLFLRKIDDHPNEQIRELLNKELKDKKKTSKSKFEHASVDLKLANVAVNGDTLKVMKLIDEDKVHLTFTSPPYYNARDYSFYKSYDEYLNFLKEVFAEVYRITKPGRFLIVNTSPIIIPRPSRAHSSKRYPIPFDLHPLIVSLGWEYIDDIVWLKPEASVKNRIGGFMQHRKPLAYKPNTVTEMLMVYRKKSDELIDWNIKQYSDDIVKNSLVEDGYESTNVWRIDPTFDKKHSAVFPVNLCNRIVQYYSFKGDLVFDPFAGSGTLGKAAFNLGRKFFLTEQDPMYFERIRENLAGDGLFSAEPESCKFLTLDEFQEEVKCV
jgi:DNA modification methylase